MTASACFENLGPDVLASPIDDIPRQTLGASVPMVIADEFRVVLGYFEYGSDNWVMVRFDGATHAMGSPNEEVLHGHPLYDRGMDSYGTAYEVIRSPWIAALDRVNSVHAMYNPNFSDRYRHVLFPSHDSLFECICTGYRVEVVSIDEIGRAERLFKFFMQNE